ncbi:MAG: cation:proton antiporter [Candidatus Woesearchaeota archaeon]
MAEDIFVKFLIILVAVFFIPKVLYGWKRIPFAITEVVIGAILVLLLPSYFSPDDAIMILGTLGIITIFVNAGMDADLKFLSDNINRIFSKILLQIFLVLSTTLLVMFGLSLNLTTSLIVSLAMITPSAGFIFSMIRQTHINTKDRKFAEVMVLGLEIFSILLLLIFLNLDDAWLIPVSLGVIFLLIYFLPKLLDILYLKLFKKIIGTEFAFIFVVALISAYITEFIGVHFIIGAFVAGIVSKNFLLGIYKSNDISRIERDNISGGFTLFQQIFAPFYFVSVGLSMNRDILTLDSIMLGIGLFIIIGIIRFISLRVYMHKGLLEKDSTSMNLAIITAPTLVFTFVISGILYSEMLIGSIIYSSLLIYGILTSTVPIIFSKKIN